jgi:hypothetical protein
MNDTQTFFLYPAERRIRGPEDMGKALCNLTHGANTTYVSHRQSTAL